MHLATKIVSIAVVLGVSCSLFSSSAVALTVLAIQGDRTNVYLRKFGENCPPAKEWTDERKKGRKVKEGTRLGKTQGLCIGKGAKVTVQCDNPPTEGGQREPQDFPELTNPPFRQICPRDPSIILEP